MDEIDGLGQLTDYRRLCSDLTLQTKKEGFFKVHKWLDRQRMLRISFKTGKHFTLPMEGSMYLIAIILTNLTRPAIKEIPTGI